MKKIFLTTVILSFVLFLTNCNTENKSSPDTNVNAESKNIITKVSNVSVSQTNNTQTAETDYSSNKPIHLTKKMFLEKVMDYETNPDKWVFRGDKPCMIDFYADWCRPCKMVAPVIEKLAKDYFGRVTVYKINTQTEQELAAVFGIQSIPSFLFCPKSGKPTMFSGIGGTLEDTEKKFKEKLDEMLKDTHN